MFTNETIRELRQRLRLTTTEFGALLGVTNATVSRWESEDEGKRRYPSFRHLLKLNELAQQHKLKLGRKLQSV